MSAFLCHLHQFTSLSLNASILQNICKTTGLKCNISESLLFRFFIKNFSLNSFSMIWPTQNNYYQKCVCWAYVKHTNMWNSLKTDYTF